MQARRCSLKASNNIVRALARVLSATRVHRERTWKFKETTWEKSRHELGVEGNYDSLLCHSPFTSSTSTKNFSGAFYSLEQLSKLPGGDKQKRGTQRCRSVRCRRAGEHQKHRSRGRGLPSGGTRVGSCWFVEMESSFHKSSTYQLLNLSPLSSGNTVETVLNLNLFIPHRINGKAKSR